MSPAFKNDWQSAIKNQVMTKAEFFQLAGERHGAELQKFMEGTLIARLTSSKSVVLRGTGKWISIPQLREKYEKEPERCAAIEKNTRYWWCNVGECDLVEDMEYVSEQETRTKRELEESWQSSIHERVKRVKTPKPPAEVVDGAADGAAAAGAEPAPDGSAKPLNMAHRKWLEKVVATDPEHASKVMRDDLQA